jgi:hypothetical protein
MTQKFRKKPVVIEADQFLPPHVPKGVTDVYSNDGVHYVGIVETIHGQRTIVTTGDWIITEPDGIHHYPCKPEIFEKTYEPINPQP